MYDSVLSSGQRKLYCHWYKIQMQNIGPLVLGPYGPGCFICTRVNLHYKKDIPCQTQS